MKTTERLVGEPLKAYEAFQVYLKQDPHRRSLRNLAKQIGKSHTLVMEWSARYHWQDRLLYRSREENEIERKAMEKAALERARELERRKQIVEDDAWEVRTMLIKQVKAMLNTPPHKIQEFTDDEGRHVIMHPHKWDFSAASRAAQVADVLGRMASGMPVTRTELNGTNGAPLNPIAPPNIQVVIHRDKNSEEARKLF